MMVYWGAFPFKTRFEDNFEAMARSSIKILKGRNFLVKGDRAAVVSDVNPRKKVDILEIREIE